MNEPIVRLEDITKIYDTGGKVRALDRVTLEINRGETVALMGVSGSGKSTLLNLICGLDTPTSGHLFFNGVDLSSLNDNDCTRLRRENIGIVFQTFNLLPTLSALENVALTLRLQGHSRKESNARATEMLKLVGLTHRLTHVPDDMSGGERQRIAIARALVFNPLLLLADEPTGNLDSVTGQNILELLISLHDRFGTTIVIVTHNELAAAHCARRITMLDGKILSDEKASVAGLVKGN